MPMRALAVLALFLALPALAAPAYVDPRIGVHERQKRDHLQRHDLRWLSWRGLRPDAAWEHVAVYLPQPPDATVQAVWRQRGLELEQDFWVPPVPGGMPSLTSGRPIFPCASMTRAWHAKAISHPPPKVVPCSAATTGLLTCSIACTTSRKCGSCVGKSNSRISAPATKVRPAAAKTIA